MTKTLFSLQFIDFKTSSHFRSLKVGDVAEAVVACSLPPHPPIHSPPLRHDFWRDRNYSNLRFVPPPPPYLDLCVSILFWKLSQMRD